MDFPENNVPCCRQSATTVRLHEVGTSSRCSMAACKLAVTGKTMKKSVLASFAAVRSRRSQDVIFLSGLDKRKSIMVKRTQTGPLTGVIQREFEWHGMTTCRSFLPLPPAIRIAGMSMLIGETMKLKFFHACLLTTGVFAAQAMNPVMAQTHDLAPAQRIEKGLASGQITPDEAQILTRREREIQRREAHYKSNGNATPQERQQWQNELNALNAEVEHMMANDDVVRPPVNAANTLEIDSPDYQVSERIDEGICSGRITQRQARRLQRREREIARHEVFFKSDGVVTPYEYRQLRDELDTLRNDVERMINTDRQGRG